MTPEPDPCNWRLLAPPRPCTAPRALTAGAVWPDAALREHCVSEPTWTAVASPLGEGRGDLALWRPRPWSRVRLPAPCPQPPPTRRLPAAPFPVLPGTPPVQRRLVFTNRYKPRWKTPNLFSFLYWHCCL